MYKIYINWLPANTAEINSLTKNFLNTKYIFYIEEK